jgi:hypothetical protein
MVATDTMLRVSPHIRPAGAGGHGKERIIMGNAALAGELVSTEELDELYQLYASENGPEDDEEGDEEGDEEEDEEPDDMSHP